MEWCALFNCKCEEVSSVWDILPSCDNDCGNCEFRVEKDSKQSE